MRREPMASSKKELIAFSGILITNILRKNLEMSDRDAVTAGHDIVTRIPLLLSGPLSTSFICLL